ncbi:DNA alkylation repair protein [Streptococcus pneumoniae]|nr:DNA alkylation repair protein [Streptococcus pneumoniae]
MVKTTDRLEAIGFSFILFENLFKPRQSYLQPQSSALSNLRLVS